MFDKWTFRTDTYELCFGVMNSLDMHPSAAGTLSEPLQENDRLFFMCLQLQDRFSAITKSNHYPSPVPVAFVACWCMVHSSTKIGEDAVALIELCMAGLANE